MIYKSIDILFYCFIENMILKVKLIIIRNGDNMKKNKNLIIAIISIVVIAILLGVIIFANINKKNNIGKVQSGDYKILTSFYPLYIMTLNITQNANNVEVSNMAEKSTGCIHDYTLSTSDLKKFENTNVFIQNGAGLESFSQKIIDAYPNVKIVSAADAITNFIKDDDGDSNGHVWLGIDNYKLEVSKISEELQKLNPENATIYSENTKQYLQKITEIESKYDEIKNKFNYATTDNANYLNMTYQANYTISNKCICLNESLEYLLKDVNIVTTMIETDHEQSALSAEEIKNIITKMKNENIKMIFIDKNDDSKTADTIAKETGAIVYRLDSEMTGNKDLNAYTNAMNSNYEVLNSIH